MADAPQLAALYVAMMVLLKPALWVLLVPRLAAHGYELRVTWRSISLTVAAPRRDPERDRGS
jgi:hypothetical protein